MNDATLLERFVTGREEAAFAVLMQRHVSVVRAACRRILQSEHDTEDVVQATFLVLALKAAEIPWRDSVDGWLCAVARRLPLDARAGVWRRRRRETPLATLSRFDRRGGRGSFPEPSHPWADPRTEIDRLELRRVLDDELNLLPEKYREPVVLCDLEGLTHTEAARRLGLPSGSISRRLSRARGLLRHRLAGRGLTLTAVLLLVALVGLRGTVRDPKGGRATGAVLEAMAPFEQPDSGGLDLERLLSRIGRDEPTPTLRDEASAVARRAAQAAERIEEVDPGRDRAAWRSYAGEMRRSALLLAQASREGDGPALLSAARRASASCVHCHLAFRHDGTLLPGE